MAIVETVLRRWIAVNWSRSRTESGELNLRPLVVSPTAATRVAWAFSFASTGAAPPCPVYRWRSRRFSLAACSQPVGDLAEVGNDVVGRVLGGDLDRDPHPPGTTVALLGWQAASPTRPRRA